MEIESRRDRSKIGALSMSATTRPRIIFANDNPVELIGIQKVLSSRFDLDIILQIMQTKDIINKVQNQCFDLIILDLSYRDYQKGEVLVLIKELKKMKKQTPIMITGDHEDRQYAVHAYWASWVM